MQIFGKASNFQLRLSGHLFYVNKEVRVNFLIDVILNFQFLSMFSPYFGRIFDNFVKLGDEDVWELEPYDPVLFHVKNAQILN